MDTLSSQVTSAALHGAFLLFCFAIPTSTSLEVLSPDTRFERWVRTRIALPEVEAREVQFAVAHVDAEKLGAGRGSVVDRGTGPIQGGGHSSRSQAPKPGPKTRSNGATKADRARDAVGNSLEGTAGEDAATSDHRLGPVTDGAEGGGGAGHAATEKPVEGSGSGGAGFGACGCGEAARIGAGGIGAGGIGQMGEPGTRIPPALNPGDLPDESEFIVPSVVASTPVVSCAPCAAIIERIIRAHMREVRYCYNRALERNSRLEGELQLNLRVSRRGGTPREARAKLAMPASSLEKCVESRMAQWVFPELPHDARVNFPVRLTRR